jgi:hypothetical protein
MPWKADFAKDVWSYKKRDRYKKNIEDVIEEKINAMFETKFRAFMDNFNQGRQLVELEQVTQTLPPPPPLSSIGSTTVVHPWYPVDDITGTRLVAFKFPSAEWETKQKRLRLVW